MHQLIAYFETFNHTFHVIAVYETWANNVHYSHLNIPRYNSLTKYRTDRISGCVALYIHELLVYKECLDSITYATSHFECVFADVQHSNFGIKVTGVIYRPPDTDANSFTLDFESFIAKVSLPMHKYLIASDFNIKILKYVLRRGSTIIYQHYLFQLLGIPYNETS